jgi:hypothetical protein
MVHDDQHVSISFSYFASKLDGGFNNVFVEPDAVALHNFKGRA